MKTHTELFTALFAITAILTSCVAGTRGEESPRVAQATAQTITPRTVPAADRSVAKEAVREIMVRGFYYKAGPSEPSEAAFLAMDFAPFAALYAGAVEFTKKGLTTKTATDFEFSRIGSLQDNEIMPLAGGSLREMRAIIATAYPKRSPRERIYVRLELSKVGDAIRALPMLLNQEAIKQTKLSYGYLALRSLEITRREIRAEYATFAR